MAKNIALFSDGTGNSAAKLFKTNVWRLYEALDVRSPRSPEQLRQVAYYHDGVGTSTFRPLALLGGIFGFGLKRNVIQLYKFLCRNYEPGDNIYCFGFSRGAFTIRVLVGVVATKGILCCRTDEELNRYALTHIELTDVDTSCRSLDGRTSLHRSSLRKRRQLGLVDRLRNVRDWTIATYRSLSHQQQYGDVPRVNVKEITFVGVWDTVAAYGLPIEEFTRGIDEWVWPLSMPNYELSRKVLCARHALALTMSAILSTPLCGTNSRKKG